MAEHDTASLAGASAAWPRRLGLAGVRRTAAALSGVTLRWWELSAYGSLLVTAAVMRLWDLGSRAMHHDESLHAYYSWQLARGDGYRHDPMMHGPFQFEANAALFFVAGDSDFTARLLYAVVGTALVGLPFLFRARLGRVAALVVAALLAFSPTMFYFSRFTRNDILVAAWTLGLVICMWRYMDEGRNRYLYVAAALLALLFATKETAYLVVGVLGLYMVLLLVWRTLAGALRGVELSGVAPSMALPRVGGSLAALVRRDVRLADVSRAGAFLLLLFTLALPQAAALLSLFQDTWLLRWSKLVLATPAHAGGLIGAPAGGGLVIAGAVVFALLSVSVAMGAKWRWSVWWRSAAIFYTVWVLLYSTFFTNMAGIGSGAWRSLGYWVAQQEVARGSQPSYYYLVIGAIYEFLPLLFSVAAGVYYLRRRDPLGRFLVFWAVATFILYTLASEKMPWLLVNVTLPLIVLAGKFLVDVAKGIRWRRFASGGGLYALAGVPLLLWALWRLALAEVDTGDAQSVLRVVGLLAVVVALLAAGLTVARRTGARDLAAFAAIPVALVLLGLTVRAGWRLNYQNGDVPVELMVYTQTSPDIPRALREIRGLHPAAGQQGPESVSIDGTSGFAWPWAWYLRDYGPVGYPTYGGSDFTKPPAPSVLVVHSANKAAADPALRESYSEGERLRHRWWFPEETYRGLTVGKVLGGVVDRKAWRTAMDYFMDRKLKPSLGSEDSYLYLPRQPE